MDQHPLPRQITSFEFKLIGFLTIKQFIYIIVFVGLAFVVYLIFPIPILNILLAIATAGIGAALAFLPVNDRPLEVWIRNLIKRLLSPTQYQYKKSNQPPKFLIDMPVSPTDDKRVASHIDSQKKLNSYMGNKGEAVISKKQNINDLMRNSLTALVGNKPQQKNNDIISDPKKNPPQQKSQSSGPKKPFFTGTIKNHNSLPLYGILVYVKGSDSTAAPLRILKTNVNGVFATFNPLPDGEYLLEIKDPKEVYLFDTMKVKIPDSNPHPFQIISKELI